MTSPARIVALGGGHGLYATLSALKGVTDDLTAIVTVADDGGSSGRLRHEMGIVPPGDLRMALSALCADNEWGRRWRDVLQRRFSTDGPLDGHAVGNLLIAAVWERNGSVVDGLAWVGDLLQARGRVLPLAAEPLEVSATVRTSAGVVDVVGQVAVASCDGTIEELRLTPAQPTVPEETIDAIDHADLVVLGPGSWYTSVLTHFHVAPVASALARAGDRAVVVLNLGHEDSETAGTGRAEDVAALRRAAPEFAPRTVLCDTSHAEDAGLRAAVADWGADLRVADLAQDQSPYAHETQALYRELASVARARGLHVNVQAPGVAG